MEKPIYLDYNATTPLDPRVLATMRPYLEEEFGNPASASHSYGWVAQSAVQKARQQVAQLIGAQPHEILWTSGATESNNLAILGLIKSFKGENPHIITTKVEHKAVLQVCEMAEEELGAEVTYLDVDRYGQVSVENVKGALKPNTKLISIMIANNEVGTINPAQAIGALAQSHGVFFHTDAAQAVGKMPIDVNKMGIDLLSLSGHKIYGPKGVGALFVKGRKPQIPLRPIMRGGEQERGLRPGTLNVSGIVGLGQACELAESEMREEAAKLTPLRDRLIETLLKEAPGAQLNGHPTDRLYNNANFSFHGLSSDQLSIGLHGLAVSSGSACSSASGAGSYVLEAMGVPTDLTKATLRMGLGRYTEPEHIDKALHKILKVANTKMTKKNKDISL